MNINPHIHPHPTTHQHTSPPHNTSTPTDHNTTHNTPHLELLDSCRTTTGESTSISTTSIDFTDSINYIINCTQINLHKNKSAWGTLVNFIKGDRLPIILATEPYSFKSGNLPRVHSDLIKYHHNQPRGGQGRGGGRTGSTTGDLRACILVHKSLEKHCWLLPDLTNHDQTVVCVKLNSVTIILASVYMDYKSSAGAPPPALQPVIDYANQLQATLIIGSDTNSRHVLWGDRLTNNRGEDLLNFLNDNDITWINRGCTPTFVNTRNFSSIVDLTLVNGNGLDITQNWKVSTKFSHSDHRYVRFEIVTTSDINTQQTRLIRKTDWKQFREEIENSSNLQTLTAQSENINSEEDLDTVASNLNTMITAAYHKSCPITYTSSKIKKPPWLTQDIIGAQKEIQHKLKKARKVNTPPIWEQYRLRLKHYKKLLKKTKRSAWRTFCKNAETVKENARMFKIIKGCSEIKEKLGVVYRSNPGPPQELTDTPEETLEEMSKVHFKEDATPPVSTTVQDNINTPQPHTDDVIKDTYDVTKADMAVKNLNPYKAPGPDGIYPAMIQHAWHHTKQIILNIMKHSHRHHITPSLWKESRAVFIPKPGKTDYHNPKSYRTITLSPVLLKLQERLVYWHMQSFSNLDKLTNERQYGFKKGVSTETALHKVVNTIERRFANKGYVLGTFLDIEGAFDNVSFTAIDIALKKSPLDTCTTNWITNMVSNRYVTVNHKTATKRIKIRRGCPQGGVLSPFLWNLIVDDLLNYTAKEIPGYLQAFADDLICLCEGDDLEVIRSRTQKTINTIEKWCTTKGLNISALKTQIVMFTWNRNWSLDRGIKVGGHHIELSNSAKFLGVTLDSKLNFNEHITNITNKARASLMQCKRAVGPTWGLSPKTCKWMYTCAIRPILSYSSVIWINALNKQYNVKKLERVQALALRIASGAMPSTSTESLNNINNIPSIINYIKGEAAKSAYRLKATQEWTVETNRPSKGTITAHSTINNEYIKNLQLPSGKPDHIKPVLNTTQPYIIHLPIQDELNTHRQNIGTIINNLDKEVITCYTDGSKTSEGTGMGYHISSNNNTTTINQKSYKLPDHCTVYMAELLAIKEASNYLLSEEQHDRKISFLTDSLSSLQALTATTITSKTVLDCHHTLSTLAEHNQVDLRWIPGHENHAGNETADELAKQGTTSNNNINSYIPISLIKKTINDKVKEESTEQWSAKSTEHVLLTIGHLNDVKTKALRKDLNYLGKKRNKFRAATHIITGHAPLNYHLHKIGKSSTSICPSCELEDETVEHLIARCPALAQLRFNMLNHYYSDLTTIFNTNRLSTIVNFGQATGRISRGDMPHTSGVT